MKESELERSTVYRSIQVTRSSSIRTWRMGRDRIPLRASAPPRRTVVHWRASHHSASRGSRFRCKVKSTVTRDFARLRGRAGTVAPARAVPTLCPALSKSTPRSARASRWRTGGPVRCRGALLPDGRPVLPPPAAGMTAMLRLVITTNWAYVGFRRTAQRNCRSRTVMSREPFRASLRGQILTERGSEERSCDPIPRWSGAASAAPLYSSFGLTAPGSTGCRSNTCRSRGRRRRGRSTCRRRRSARIDRCSRSCRSPSA
jgi:hypothetical protein